MEKFDKWNIVKKKTQKTKRVLNKIGIINKEEFKTIQEKLVKIVGPTL